ncbi:hypothetical protein [Hafnia paralvei]|uniref:hypothetical protein n=1 Tax=Hafnia paralvei TaxID=546367 RepID=UPI001CC9BC42|nr:hypothetical protein [Hafnia paralvei]UBM39725.1 hypothetical protein K9N75_15295 [Hafnia paralvei]
MALTKEEKMQRLAILGMISELEEKEREEILGLRDKLSSLLKEASKKEFSVAALALMVCDIQEEE